MTLKQRLALYLSVAFSLLFGLAVLAIYFSFSSFRIQEFSDRLEEEATSDIKLLTKSKEIDQQLLKIIDGNTVHKLYNEKTLIFDDAEKLIYSSIAEALVSYNPSDLKKLKKNHRLFRQNNEKELLGLYYESKQGNYYVLITAEDKYGNSKLAYLAYTMLLVFIIGSLLVWGITYFIVVYLVKPLDVLQERIADITIHEINSQLPETQRKDEINLLSKSFNQMLRRIENAYNAQREFTANASHELLTPISRLGLQLNNMMLLPQHEQSMAYLKSMSNDVDQMADLVQSLLLLGKINRTSSAKKLKKERVDEILFDAFTVVKKQFPSFEMNFEISDSGTFMPSLEVAANRSLLEIAFVNLFKNICLYSDNQQVMLRIEQANEKMPLQLFFENTGQTTGLNPIKIFEPFVRGNHQSQVAGSGLGLRIVKRILYFHEASINYHFINPNVHQFLVVF